MTASFRPRDHRTGRAPMLMRTYTRTYRGVITETFVLGPADLTDQARQ